MLEIFAGAGNDRRWVEVAINHVQGTFVAAVNTAATAEARVDLSPAHAQELLEALHGRREVSMQMGCGHTVQLRNHLGNRQLTIWGPRGGCRASRQLA